MMYNGFCGMAFHALQVIVWSYALSLSKFADNDVVEASIYGNGLVLVWV